MSEQNMDFAKVLAMLSQQQEAPPPLENVEQRVLDVPYITKEGSVDVRKVRIYIPEQAGVPMPLIYVPHYEMGEDAAELRSYLAEGWAVASPTQTPDDYNAKLTDDDLVFNNAALYTLRQMSEFDKKRIAIVGGSAGGYMTLMLTGMNLGICASIANGPIANTYFNFYHYFPMAQALNMQALAKIMAESADGAQSGQEGAEKPTPMEVMKKLAGVPIPFLAGLSGQFAPLLENFPDKEDVGRWEALSGVGVASRFSNPVMVNHSTSDVLVPVDQISKRYTYKKPGASLPEDFDALLPQSFPGKLKKSLEECLPEKDMRTLRIPVPENTGESVLPYDSEKQFNLNIFDDGPIEGYGSHSSRMDIGRRLDLPYLREMLERTSSRTNALVPDMVKFLLCLYEGKCIALPVHAGVDDTVYGSHAIYRKKVCEELTDWVEVHGKAALKQVFIEVLEDASKTEASRLKTIMDEIMECLEIKAS